MTDIGAEEPFDAVVASRDWPRDLVPGHETDERPDSVPDHEDRGP